LTEETEILHRRHKRQQEDVPLTKITNAKMIVEMRMVVETVHVDEDLETYIASIVQETRHDRHVAVGSSPRGSLAFLKMARAHAVLQGRDYVLPDDIKRFGTPVLSHRLILQPEYWLTRQVADNVIADIFAKVPVPVLKDV
jgi:MoxR-like ATPase